jgi:hypothetical protein
LGGCSIKSEIESLAGADLSAASQVRFAQNDSNPCDIEKSAIGNRKSAIS